MRWRDLFSQRRAGIERAAPTQRQQIVFGLDFGTAFTKVVIGEVRGGFAVPFGSLAHQAHPYLLGSAFSVQGTGQCTLHPAMGRTITDLKMRILNGNCGPSDEAKITAFLAMVFQYGRDWLLNTHEDVYKNTTLDWVINVGLPTDSFHDDQLVDLYRLLAKSAWDLSLNENTITIEHASNVISETRLKLADKERADDGIVASKISAFPEFIAGLAGYVRSSHRTPGLHCLVDVGAGTLDVTVFNVLRSQEGEDRYPVFGRSVKHLGTSYFARYRAREAGVAIRFDPAQDLPDNHEFAAILNITPEQLDGIDDKFDHCVRSTIMELLRETRKFYLPNLDAWRSVPLFLCGGGARARFYARLVSEMCRLSQGFNLQLRSLPMPERLDAELIEDRESDRLAVAYGLSFEPFDLGEVIRQSEIPRESARGDDGEPTGYRPGYIGPEHV